MYGSQFISCCKTLRHCGKDWFLFFLLRARNHPSIIRPWNYLQLDAPRCCTFFFYPTFSINITYTFSPRLSPFHRPVTSKANSIKYAQKSSEYLMIHLVYHDTRVSKLTYTLDIASSYLGVIITILLCLLHLPYFFHRHVKKDWSLRNTVWFIQPWSEWKRSESDSKLGSIPF